MMIPWRNRKGEFSPLKALLFLACLLPGLWISWKLGTNQMGPKPVNAALHETGTWAVRLLLVTLTITPLRAISGQNRLIIVRRMLGLAALSYTLIHFGLYIVDQKFNLITVAREIVLRIYLTIGFLSMAAMIALGVTSTDGMIRKLGGARWNQLHRLMYPLTVLALIHAFMQAKIDVSEEVVMSGIFLILMGVRLCRPRMDLTPFRLFGLAMAGACSAMIVEFFWYALATGVPAMRVLAANFNPDLAPRPALIVALFGLALPLIAWFQSRASRKLQPYASSAIHKNT